MSQPKLIELLLEKGADPLIKNKEGITALKAAESSSIMQELREGVD